MIKNKHKYILPIIQVILLCTYSAWKLNDVDTLSTPSAVGVERSFVWINSDSLETCLTKTYPADVKVSKSRKKFEIEYSSNKSMLMHTEGEGVTTDRESLIHNAKSKFKCEKKDNCYKITLNVEDGFVYCPTALLLPLLDDNKNN